MAMQICVLSDHLLNSVAEWQTAINVEGFPLQLSDADPKRNLAARLGGEETSIEYDAHDFIDLKDTYRHVNFERGWKYAISFTWSSKLAESIAAWMGATAYARATSGVIFDEQEVKLFTPDESLKIVRDIERSRPAMEAMLRDFAQTLSPKSPEADAALQSFMKRHLNLP